MFGGSLFRDDPFFSNSFMDEFDQMDRMMASMHQSMGIPSIAAHSQHLNRHHNSHNQAMSLMPFGGSMFPDMTSMMSMAAGNGNGNGNGQFFSSSKVISYTNDGSGAPKYYEATSETRHGPNGVRQTKRSERNSETGIDRMAVGHHIHDRGHVVERSRNSRTNEREEKHDFLNMDEDDKDAFHEEWKQKARMSSSRHTGGRALRNERSQHPYEQRAINSADYHRRNLERSRTHHGNYSNNRDRY